MFWLKYTYLKTYVRRKVVNNVPVNINIDLLAENTIEGVNICDGNQCCPG